MDKCYWIKIMCFFLFVFAPLKAHADYFRSYVHFDCHHNAGEIYAKIFTVYEYDPAPKGDFEFRDLVGNPQKLACQIPGGHTVTFRAVPDERTSTRDALELFVDQKPIYNFAIGIGGPFESPMRRYFSSIRITTATKGGLHLEKTEGQDIH